MELASFLSLMPCSQLLFRTPFLSLPLILPVSEPALSFQCWFTAAIASCQSWFKFGVLLCLILLIAARAWLSLLLKSSGFSDFLIYSSQLLVPNSLFNSLSVTEGLPLIWLLIRSIAA